MVRLQLRASTRRLSTSAACARPVRRSLLYVPAHAQRLSKLGHLVAHAGTDALALDLEDSVPEHAKAHGRSLVLDALQAQSGNEATKGRLLVRVNSLSSGLTDDDLAVVLRAPHLHGIVLPKVNSRDELVHVDKLIDTLRDPHMDDIAMIACIESPLALMNLKEIATASRRVDTLLFAAEDYCAASNIVRTSSRHELLYARSAIVAAAKAYALNAIDLVCVEFKDRHALEQEASEGRRLGFDGKQAIHPAQVDTIQRAFSPSDSEIERARRILSEYDQASRQGKGAYSFKELDTGKEVMIDAPMLLQARAILNKVPPPPPR